MGGRRQNKKRKFLEALYSIKAEKKPTRLWGEDANASDV